MLRKLDLLFERGFRRPRRLGAGASLDGPIWDELRALNPRARYESFEGAGHPVVFTKPPELAAVVRDFLEG